jgi:hypothetical protein
MQKQDRNILKPIIGNDSLREISNDNGVKVVNYGTQKLCKVYSVPTLQQS